MDLGRFRGSERLCVTALIFESGLSMGSYDRGTLSQVLCLALWCVIQYAWGGKPLWSRGGVVVSGSVENLSVLGGTCMLDLLGIVG